MKKTNKDGDGDNGLSKTCPIAAASTAGTGETGDDTEDYNKNGDEIDDNGDCTGEEDLIYYYSDDDDDEETTEVDGAEPIERADERYIVLSQDAIRGRQEADIAKVTDVLSVPPGIAAILLRHYKWRVMRLQEEWFSDDRRIRDAVGLPADGGVLVPTALISRRRVAVDCAICFGSFPAGRTRSAACSTHLYCVECWRGYVRAAVEDGPRCLSLRCPDTSCSAAVARELVDEVADAKDRARYARFALWSFVDESGGRVKWCPGRGCSRAVEFVGCAGDATEVFCECTHGFCWSCGEEAHRPVSCETVRAWLAKNVSDSETANWVLTNTKLCPKCRRPIEKNQGCNNMTCSAPCYCRFCWICLQPLGRRHIGCHGYRAQPGKVNAGGKDEQRREQAKASLDRYLYHYERWAANDTSLQKVFKDMADLEGNKGLEKMAKKVRVPASDLRFLTRAYEQVADGRRVLRWAHAYGYFLDPKRDAIKRNLFDQLQKDANSSLERLHGCAEGERMELCAGDAADVGERYKSYKEKLQSLTQVTRHYFENLVKAFETNLAEVETTE